MTRLRLATVNVNGIRAAFRKGMGDWLADRDVDVLALQEVRASTEDLTGCSGTSGTSCTTPPPRRAGPVWRSPPDTGAPAPRRARAEDFDSAGRWIEADYEIGGRTVTVVSTYVHSGEVDTPKQVEKWKFLDAMTERLPALRAHNPLAVVVGDLNVGHDQRDIKNWKGNVKRAGFLPRERAYFSRFFGPRASRSRVPTAPPGRATAGWTSAAPRPATSTALTRGGPGAARRSTTTPGGASTTRSRRRSSPAR